MNRVILALATVAAARIPFDVVPHPTNAVPVLGFPPATTPKPDLRNALVKRQSANTDTCGYFDGDAALPFSCDSGNVCVENDHDRLFGCCSTDAAGEPIPASCVNVDNGYTSCYDNDRTTSCRGTCTSYNLLCGPTSPYCAVAYSHTGTLTYSAYFCQSFTDSLAVVQLFATPVMTGSGTVSTEDTTTPGPTTDSSRSTTPGRITTSPTPPPTPTPTPTPNPSSTNTGAIAGGVVGGLVGLGLIVAGAIYFLQRSKKKEIRGSMAEVSQI